MSYICIPKSQLDLALSSTNTDSSGTELAGLQAAVYGSNKPLVHGLHDVIRMFGGAASFSNHGGAGVLDTTGSGIAFFKGIPPTQSEFKNGFPVGAPASGITYRSTDKLLHLRINTSKFRNITNGVVCVGVNGGNATASGTATWFVVQIDTGYVDTTYSDYVGPVYALMGTVGTIGSGADLELTTNEIIAGSLYRLGEINIPFQNIFEA